MLKAILNMLFSFAIAHDRLNNPCCAVKVPRGLPKTKRETREDPVLKKIAAAVDTMEFCLFPYLLLYTGCRRGEALALTWGDIDPPSQMPQNLYLAPDLCRRAGKEELARDKEIHRVHRIRKYGCKQKVSDHLVSAKPRYN